MGTCSLMRVSCGRSGRPRCRIYLEESMGLGVNEVVGNQMMMMMVMK